MKFKTRFWELLSAKEQADGTRYAVMSAIAEQMGISRITLYKYAHEPMASVDANTVAAFLDYFGLEPGELNRFLVLEDNPQLDAQEVKSNGAILAPTR